jgi:hypothetical protein
MTGVGVLLMELNALPLSIVGRIMGISIRRGDFFGPSNKSMVKKFHGPTS